MAERSETTDTRNEDVTTAALDGETFEISVDPRSAHTAPARSLAARVIRERTSLDDDAAAGTDIMVDGMCAILVRRAMPGSVITCRFTARSLDLVLAASTRTGDEQPPSTTSFEWRLLANLADTATTWVDADSTDGSGHVVHVELVKRWPLA